MAGPQPRSDVAERVLAEVDALAPTLVADAADLVRIPSVGGTDAEHDAQAHVAARLRDDGLEVDHWRLPLAALEADADFPGAEVHRDEAWGVVARLAGAGDGPTLLFDGHVDVVPPGDLDAWTRDPWSGEVHGDALHGRGSADMKAGLTAAQVAVSAIRRAGVTLGGDVLVASVVGEEDGGLGTFGLLRRGWTADACVIPEPTDLAVVPANGGALTFRLRIRGRAAHAARRSDGVSAVDGLWPIWSALRALEEERHRTVDPMTAHLPLAHPISIGTVRAGDWASSVPDLLVAEGRMGVALGETVAEAEAALEGAVADACAADPWLREHPVEVEWWGGRFASARIPADHPLVHATGDAHARAGGAGRPPVHAAPYGSDLRLLVGIGDIPTVQYGPGAVHLAHGPDEHVRLDDLQVVARTLALVALEVCGVA